MSVTFIGTKSVGAFAKGVEALSLPALLQYLAELTSQNLDLQGRLAIYAKLSGTVVTDPATLIAQLTAALAALKDQLTSIVAGAIPAIPTATASVDASILALLPRIAALQLIIDQIKGAVSLGGVHLFSVDSTPAEVGAELAALVSAGIDGGLPNARIQGVIAVTSAPATYTALSAMVRTT